MWQILLLILVDEPCKGGNSFVLRLHVAFHTFHLPSLSHMEVSNLIQNTPCLFYVPCCVRSKIFEVSWTHEMKPQRETE